MTKAKYSLAKEADRGGRTIVPTAWIRLARRSNKDGKLAQLAIELLTEARYKDGRMDWFGYRVMAKRGEVVLSMNQLAKAMDCKRETVARRLDEVCADMGWICAYLDASDPCVLGETPGGNPRGRPQNCLGVKVTICNYDELQAFGGDPKTKAGQPQGATLSDHIPSCSPSQDSPTNRKERTTPLPPSKGDGSTCSSSSFQDGSQERPGPDPDVARAAAKYLGIGGRR